MRMPARIQMLDSPHVPRPAQVARILRSSHDKFSFRKTPRNGNQPFIDLWVPVGRIGSHVTHVAGISLALTPSVMVRIYGAIKRHGMSRAELLPQRLQHRTAGEAKVDVEARNLFRAQIWRAALLTQLRDCDGSINVVEPLHRHRRSDAGDVAARVR